MKQSNLFIPTQKDISNQATAVSHIYALKAGLIHQTAAGIYSYLPYGTMLIEKIKNIINEELQNIGANLLTLPLLEPAELWQKSGRWDSYGSELFRIKDRRNSEFALAPTHEEVITDLVKNNLRSYKNFPLNLYQIGTKFRDEARPRFGLLRGREFIMMDGYSFHTSYEDLDITYQAYYNAYKNILNRLKIDYKVVVGDNGQMGGNKSHEFMALGDIGEDTIAVDPLKEIAYNSEIAPIYTKDIEYKKSKLLLEEVSTPDIKKIDELSEFLNIERNVIIKSLVYKVGKEYILFLLKGSDEINELKIGKIFNSNLELASEQEVSDLNLVRGFIGPIDANITVIGDNSLKSLVDMYCGANKKDFHFKNVDVNRDIPKIRFEDIRWIKENEKMFEDGGNIYFKKSIEVGHIFALGDKYTRDLNVEYLDKNQKLNFPVMGCYGIGVSRLLSALIEQNNDENGIIFPSSVSPFDVHLIVLDYNKKEEQKVFSDNLYETLKSSGLKVLMDDRDERPGIKFKESDLLGIPNQVVVGRNFKDNILEFKKRNQKDRRDITLENLLGEING